IVPVDGSSRIALSERLLATRSWSPDLPGTTVRPAGYGRAVPLGVLKSAWETHFPSASFCRGILITRRGAILPASKEKTAMALPVLPGFSPVGSVMDPREA